MTSAENSIARVSFTFQPSYRVLDLSGNWDFAIDFYVVLRTPEGTPNPNQELKVWRPESLLNLNYALKHGYLQIIDMDADGRVLDFGGLESSSPSQAPEYAIIPRNTGHWYRCCKKFSTPLDPQVMARFTPQHRYRLQVTEQGLSSPVKWCKFIGGNDAGGTGMEAEPTAPKSNIKVEWKKQRSGQAQFKALSSLKQPPNIQLSLSATSPTDFRKDEDPQFQVEIINQSDQTVTFRSEGRQSFLQPLDVLYQPVFSDHKRITASGESVERTSVFVVDTSTGQQLIDHTEREHRPPPPSHFTSLEPGIPLVKRGSLRSILPPSAPLKAGQEYKLSIRPLPVDWVWGLVQDAKEFDSKVGAPSKSQEIPPVILESADEIVFKIVQD